MGRQQSDYAVLLSMQLASSSGISSSSAALDAELLCGLVSPGADLPGITEYTCELRRRALQSAAASVKASPAVHEVSTCDHLAGPKPVQPTLVGASFFLAAEGRPIVVVDLFGGIGVGLEMALRSGLHIKRYYHVDLDGVTRQIMQHRLSVLQQQYPDQLPVSALQGVWDLPQDVHAISEGDLRPVGAGRGEQWLVVAGWPCQDLSRAGKQAGLAGLRSGAF